MEQAGQALMEQLPDGVLRRSAEQRLTTALQGQSDQTAAIPAKPQSGVPASGVTQGDQPRRSRG